MTFNEIRQAIESRFATWSTTPIKWDNVEGTTGEIKGQAWIRITINSGASIIASVADAPEVRHTGLIDVQVFVEEGRGTRPAYVIADEIAQLMQFYRTGHFETEAASLTRVGHTSGWFSLLVSVPYRAGC